jgi:dTDP-4-amino-4,6-dideoxygalactose transaminase
MLKAVSRAHVDLKINEIISTLFQLLNIKEATNSDKVTEFEKDFAGFIGTKQAVSFPYCRTGMYYALKALGLKEDDEIILPAFTFWVDAAMIVLAGLKPVFVDVQFESANIDPSKIEEAITPKTKVIFPTHLNGLPADMKPIMEIAKKHNLRVLEDCARSCGATYKNKRVGSFDIGAFSFGYGKSFYGFGGAMVTSDDESFIERLRELKKGFHNVNIKDLYIQTLKGSLLKFLNSPYLYKFTLFPVVYQFQVKGKGSAKYASLFRIKMPPYDKVPYIFMVDMNNVQAKLGFKQLKRIDMTNKKRIENAKILTEELSGISELLLPSSPDDREHVSVHYAIWTEKNRELQRYLTLNNIDAQDETAVNTTLLERFKPYVNGKFTNAEKLHDKIVFLPTHPNFNKNDMIYIAKKVKEYFVKN